MGRRKRAAMRAQRPRRIRAMPAARAVAWLGGVGSEVEGAAFMSHFITNVKNRRNGIVGERAWFAGLVAAASRGL